MADRPLMLLSNIREYQISLSNYMSANLERISYSYKNRLMLGHYICKKLDVGCKPQSFELTILTIECTPVGSHKLHIITVHYHCQSDALLPSIYI
mgnify:CR=1 FL=1